QGRGLPVGESLALGTPCPASNAPSVVEAAQGLVPTLDPLDFTAWFEHLRRWLFDPPAVDAGRDRVRARYRVPSWPEHREASPAIIAELSPGRSGVSAGSPEPDAAARVLR